MYQITHHNLVTTTKFKITSADTDMEARIRLGSLVNLLIQSAINSADNLGFGYEGLQKHKLYWVLSRMTMEISRPLEWYQEVEIDTWPKTIERILYIRDFIIRDKRQEVIIRATSGWLPIDITSKRPKKIDGLKEEMFVHLRNKHGLEKSPEKLSPVVTGNQFDMKANYFDIDLNRHVTATRYIDWMMDTLPLDFHKQHYPSYLSINYLKETMPGDVLRIKHNELYPFEYVFDGTNMGNHSTAFRGRIKF